MSEPEEDDDDDDLREARGVAIGVVFGVLLWLLLAAVVWWAVARAFR